MTPTECVLILRSFNNWKFFNGEPEDTLPLMPNQNRVRIAIDTAIQQITSAELADIETLEQENRQMRARMERLEEERDCLLEALKECDEAMVYMSEYDIPLLMPERVKAAITKVQP